MRLYKVVDKSDRRTKDRLCSTLRIAEREADSLKKGLQPYCKSLVYIEIVEVITE